MKSPPEGVTLKLRYVQFSETVTMMGRITLSLADIEGAPALSIAENWPYNAAPRFVALTADELEQLLTQLPGWLARVRTTHKISKR